MNTPQTTNGPAAAAAAPTAPPDTGFSPLMQDLVDRASERYRLGLEPGIAPKDALDAAWDIAEAAAKAGLAPNADEAYARIQIGRPLGISAMASIQGIALIETKDRDGVVRKTACMYSKLKLGLLQSRRDVIEYIRPKKGCLTNTSATWIAKRRGDIDEVEYTFTIDDAKIAGLVGRGDGKTNSAGVSMNNYDRHPGPMLSARACGRLCDIVGADVLWGLATREDLEDEARMARRQLEELADAASRGELAHALGAPPQAKPGKDLAAFAAEGEDIKRAFAAAIAKRSGPELKAVRERFAAFKAEAPAEVSELVQIEYNRLAGEAKKARGAAPAPTPAAAPAAKEPEPATPTPAGSKGSAAPATPAAGDEPKASTSPYLPPEQRGDEYDGPEEPPPGWKPAGAP